MNTINSIVSDIKNDVVKPIYFLTGEEPYYIDKIANYIEQTILTEDEKSFNQTVFYGRDTSIDAIIATAKRFPMMAEKQVVIVKEAQDLSRYIEELTAYVENFQPSTVLVLCYKYKKLDKRKKLYKAVKNNGLWFESKRLYDNQVSDWIRKVLSEKKYHIEPKAAHMLVDFLGTDLSKINNELEKLLIIFPEGTTITPLHIEENIGISKDFNNFELRKAVAYKKVVEANRIINYFADNPKSNPLIVTISSLHGFFTQLLLIHGMKDKSQGAIAKTLRINPFFVREYQDAIRNYPMRKVSHVIAFLRLADVQSKGVGSNASNADILKELLFKILH